MRKKKPGSATTPRLSKSKKLLTPRRLAYSTESGRPRELVPALRGRPGPPGENGTVESGPKRPASPIQPPHLSGRCSEPSRGCYAEFPESFRRRSCRRGSSKGALYGARTLVSQAVRPQAELSDRAKRGGMTDRNTGTSPAAQPADAGRALPIPLWGRKEPAPTRAVSGSRGLGSFNLARRFLAATADVPSGGSGSSPPAAPPPGHVPQRHYGRYSPASK